MPVIAPAFVTVNPSLIMPEILLPYSQASGAFDLLPEGKVTVRLAENDKAVFFKRIDIRTKLAAGQASYNALPSIDLTLSQFSMPTYLQRVRNVYDHHDTADMSTWGIDIVSAYRLGSRQGHFQLGRSALLSGFNPANGEGLINTAGATALNLPPDSFGNTTVTTYDNGQMALFLSNQVQLIKSATNNLGIGRKFTILGPQRTLGTFEYNVVQVVQYQRPGAGTTSTAGVVKSILMENGDELIWAYDDTLIGKGSGGTDLVIICMPEVEKPVGDEWNTNEFAKLSPGLAACTIQLCDMPAPREIPTPIPDGGISVLTEMRVTPGLGIRPESLRLVSMQYP